jgi:hypothetical protein
MTTQAQQEQQERHHQERLVAAMIGMVGEMRGCVHLMSAGIADMRRAVEQIRLPGDTTQSR